MIVLLGGSGYVAGRFIRLFDQLGVDYWTLSSKRLHDPDYTNYWAMRRWLKSGQRPSLVINCAGYVGRPNVDACEHHKPECLAGNASLPAMLSMLFQQLKMPWMHISSGCLYQGDKDGSGWSETDLPNFSFRHNNCSFYAGCKALAEEVIEGQCYVCRLRIPFNGDLECPSNFLGKIAKYKRLVDSRNSLSHIDDFVSACWQLIDGKCPFGIYNVTNPGSLTTREIVNRLGWQKDWYGSTEEFQQEALAPRSFCVLNTSKLSRQGIHLRAVEQALDESIAQWR